MGYLGWRIVRVPSVRVIDYDNFGTGNWFTVGAEWGHLELGVTCPLGNDEVVAVA